MAYGATATTDAFTMSSAFPGRLKYHFTLQVISEIAVSAVRTMVNFVVSWRTERHTSDHG